MNAWLVAATALLAGLVPCGIVCVREAAVDALVALELAGAVIVLVLLLLAEGFQRSVYFDLALVLTLLALVGSLTFARFLGRGL